jgi:Tripartite tricarboxylate transporter TctB family
MTSRFADKNVLCGLLFIAFGVALAWNALSLEIGSASDMGSGYFPLGLSILLGFLGVILIAGSWASGARAAVAGFEWRGFVMVLLAVAVFGATINYLGFVPAVVLTLALAILASNQFRPLAGILTIVALLAFCWGVFVKGLGIPVRLFW